jgi:hypothetical protein
MENFQATRVAATRLGRVLCLRQWLLKAFHVIFADAYLGH